MSYIITRNTNQSSEHDNAIDALEGKHTELPDAINDFQKIELPNGDRWLYPSDMSEEEIERDIAGYYALARIHTVKDGVN